jgi:hypothetical protein
MRWNRQIFGFALLTALVWTGGSHVVAQTTQPADATIAAAQWTATCQQFVHAMQSGNSAGVASMLTSGAKISSFSAAGAMPQSLAALDGCLAGQTIVGVHGYLAPAMNFASDVFDDFANAPPTSIPQTAVTRMSFSGDADQKRVSPVAAKWLAQSLGAADGQPIGVAVLWPTATAGSNSATATFIIFAAQQSPDGAYRISNVIYGDPLAP